MRDLRESCRIAVVQAAPVMFDKAACTVKAVELIRAAAAERAELIVFPELFIPGYPYGMTFGFTVGSRTATGRKDWGHAVQYQPDLFPGGRTAHRPPEAEAHRRGAGGVG